MPEQSFDPAAAARVVKAADRLAECMQSRRQWREQQAQGQEVNHVE